MPVAPRTATSCLLAYELAKSEACCICAFIQIISRLSKCINRRKISPHWLLGLQDVRIRMGNFRLDVLVLKPALLATQHDDWVYTGGAAGRNIAGNKSNRSYNNDYAQKCQRVSPLYAIEDIHQEPRQNKCSDGADDHSQTNEPHHLADNQTHNF